MNNKYIMTTVAFSVLLSSFAVKAEDKEILLNSDNNADMVVSIYNNNLAFVRDTRSASLPTGYKSIAFEGVASQIKPETAMLLADGVEVIEQNYDYNLLTPINLLEESIGEVVKTAVQNPENGQTIYDSAKIINANYGTPVLQFKYGIETNFPGRLVYEKIPANLRIKPTLVINLNNKKAGDKKMELAYLTNGISWKANYVADIKKSDKLNLNGWITLNNESGADYKNAKVQVIAGSVNQSYDNVMPRPMRMMTKAMGANMEMGVMDAGAYNSMPSREAVADYYLYTLPVKTTIKDKQSKQVSLMSKENVKFEKEYVLNSPLYLGVNSDGNEFLKQNPEVIFKLVNNQESNLGTPLPAGVVRFYESDKSGNIQFIGESNIEQSAKGEKIDLKIGKAFDIFANGKVKNVVSISKDMSEADVEITLKNVKDENVKVKLEQSFGGNWQIISESIVSEKKTANIAVWKLEIPKDDKIVLTFKVRMSRK